MSTPPITADEFRATASAIEREVSRVIVGQQPLIRQLMVTLLGGGHALLEGAPGLGKTLLVRTLAQVIDCSFSRVQFTPDLMPADIVGGTILVRDDAGDRAFRFEPGPVFANLLLADEINRALPRTQSALLEAMQERHVTVAKTTHELPQPFFVLATQNPLEMEGTYPLPEAQLDRFFFKIDVPYPNLEDLLEIADRTTAAQSVAPVIVAHADTIRAMQLLARQVPIAGHVTEFAARVLMATHPEDSGAPDAIRRFVRYGASPRGLQAMILGAKVSALLDGRYNVSFDDIVAAAPPALRHRVILNFEGQAEGIPADRIVEAALKAQTTRVRQG
ncbi:MAG: MoxR family ATPase [Anaerolineae bacterium]|nr:MoxR family ATPase [Anaerolineae bacterium]